MKQIRHSVFETNSSSVHTLTIGKWKEIDEDDWTPIFLLREHTCPESSIPNNTILNADFLEWDRSEPDFVGDRASFKLSYLYTLVGNEYENWIEDPTYHPIWLTSQKYDYKEYEKHILDVFREWVDTVLAKHDIKVHWQTRPYNEEYNKYGRIDHQSYNFAKQLVEYISYPAVSWCYDKSATKADYENRLLNYLFNSDVDLDISCDG